MHSPSFIRGFLRRRHIHPRLFWTGLVSYSRFLGYVRPALLTASPEEYRVRRQLLARGWEPRKLEAPVGKRILALSPHADDESIGAGGLLWAHRDLAEIHLVVLSDGGKSGQLENPAAEPVSARQQLVQTRREELLKAAADLKARSVEFLDFPDGAIPTDNLAAEKLRSHITRIQPDVVLLPWFLDNHPDHRSANSLLAKACANERMLVLGYEVWAMLEPNAVFDISDHLEPKLALIRHFTSQLALVDYVSYAASLARVRGYHANLHPTKAGAAEAFVALPCHDYCALVNALAAAPEAR